MQQTTNSNFAAKKGIIFHENRLLADDSHEISYLIFFSKIMKDVTKFVICCSPDVALRVNFLHAGYFFMLLSFFKFNFFKKLFQEHYPGADPGFLERGFICIKGGGGGGSLC